LLLWIVAEVGERQDDNRQAWRSYRRRTRKGGRYPGCSHAGCTFRSQRIDPHWPGDVLDLLFAKVLKGVIEFVADVIAHHAADADPARFGQCFQPRRNVNPVTKDVVLFSDHVTEIDPDAKPDPLILKHPGLSVDRRALDLHSAAHRIHNTGKFRQQAIASVLYDAAPMALDLWLN